MSRKKWNVRSYSKEKAVAMAEQLNISPYAALLSLIRGVESIDDAKKFFGLEEDQPVNPMDFPDMAKAVTRIKRALDDFDRIAVYGDYDADGVTSTSLLYSYLEMQGADVVYYVPDRHTEGYGLGFSAIDKISRMGAKLIITVDNGINAIEQAKYIKELEMELIVTDHHLPSDQLPEAVAVVDPHRIDSNLEFKDYAGVGVAYKLICALEGEENDITDSFLDLVTIGTIADVMPLKGENRSIVRRGMNLINDSDRVGLDALKEVAGLSNKELGSSSVAFGLAPRINAAGRMSSAEKAIKLLLSEDYDESIDIANDINEDNLLRQKTEQEILTEALAQINENPEWIYNSILVVDGEDWHDGVIGIVASRLVEKYGKPSIVITRSGDIAKGSGRSIDGFNLYEALTVCESTLTHFGGHKLAAGMGLDTNKIDEFRKAINTYADSIEMPFPIQNVDFKINPSYVNNEILDVINLLEPFGAGNPQPIFGLFNMTVTDIRPLGNGKHLRIMLKRDATTLSAVKFRMTQVDFPFCVGDVVDVAVTIENNEYMGQQRLNILVKNIKMHSVNDDELFDSIRAFSYAMSGKTQNVNLENVIPDRELTAQIYKFIRTRETWRFDTEMLCLRLGKKARDYAKIGIAVEALCELGILVRDEENNLTLPKENVRANLNDAPVLIKLRGEQ